MTSFNRIVKAKRMERSIGGRVLNKPAPTMTVSKARAAGTYRAARMNAVRSFRAEQLKAGRISLGVTRSELDRMRQAGRA